MKFGLCMITVAVIASFAVGCRNQESVLRKAPFNAFKIKEAADKELSPDEAIQWVGTPPDLDTRKEDDEVFLLNTDFEKTLEKLTPDGELDSNDFEKSDFVLIWFDDTAENSKMNYGIVWANGSVEYFEGVFW